MTLFLINMANRTGRTVNLLGHSGGQTREMAIDYVESMDVFTVGMSYAAKESAQRCGRKNGV